MQWTERFALDVKTIPRSLFSRISMPLVWATFIKTQRRTMIGLMLFAEQNAVENMPKAVRRRLAGPGTWREAVQHELEATGGQASITDIYRDRKSCAKGKSLSVRVDISGRRMSKKIYKNKNKQVHK